MNSEDNLTEEEMETFAQIWQESSEEAVDALDTVTNRDDGETLMSQLEELQMEQNRQRAIADARRRQFQDNITQQMPSHTTPFSEMTQKNVILLNGPEAGSVKQIAPEHQAIEFAQLADEHIDTQPATTEPKQEKTLVIDDDGNKKWITNWEESPYVATSPQYKMIRLEVVTIYIDEKRVYIATTSENAQELQNRELTPELILDICDSNVSKDQFMLQVNEFGMEQQEPQYPGRVVRLGGVRGNRDYVAASDPARNNSPLSSQDVQDAAHTFRNNARQTRQMFIGSDSVGLFEEIQSQNGSEVEQEEDAESFMDHMRDLWNGMSNNNGNNEH